MKIVFPAIISFAILATLGCQRKIAATDPNPKSRTELPENTKVLQAADLVGYDGTKLRKSVQKIKDAHEKQSEAVEKLIETGPDQ